MSEVINSGSELVGMVGMVRAPGADVGDGADADVDDGAGHARSVIPASACQLRSDASCQVPALATESFVFFRGAAPALPEQMWC